ncbi:hypothetical protein [Burkholderia sp. D-99]|uniref:hypothetical protein n=1 Tax=Burkholderia sp. D-99 TaxID=2717316 RepID=UPI00141DD3EC|nr:hypothetical protein [Burkholderia sp. D-99]NHV28489.1 hypothetical protein [Burkholderia sp. D-99]
MHGRPIRIATHIQHGQRIERGDDVFAAEADFIDSDERNHATEEISALPVVSGPATANDVQANASGCVLLTLSKGLRVVVKPAGIARGAVTKPSSEWLLCKNADRSNPPSFRVARVA